VDRRFAGRGLGHALISEAFRISLRVADAVGCRAIVTDAYRDRVAWLSRYGFVPSKARWKAAPRGCSSTSARCARRSGREPRLVRPSAEEQGEKPPCFDGWQAKAPAPPRSDKVGQAPFACQPSDFHEIPRPTAHPNRLMAYQASVFNRGATGMIARQARRNPRNPSVCVPQAAWR